jgi:micrococcal nuclease
MQLATAALVPTAEAREPTGSTPPVGLATASVERVIDGDTVDVAVGGETVRLRLIGIDTPETKDPRTPVECFGREARRRAEELLDGQTVQLEADPS